MITYEVSILEGSSRPFLLKVFNIPDNEPIKIAMSTSMRQEEVDSIPTEIIFSYLDSLVNYIKDSSLQLKTIGLNESKGDYGWSMWGWEEVSWGKEEYDNWWKYAYYSRDSEE